MANGTARIVIGALLASVSAVVAAGGAAAVVLVGSDSSLTTGTQNVTSTTTALVAELDDIEGISTSVGRPELRLSASSTTPVFIGIGRAADVDDYLAGADIDKVHDIDVDPFRLDIEHRPGTARPEPPDAQAFWVAKASGPDAALEWKIRDGDYRIVVMNVDASPGIAIDGRFTLDIPWLYGVGIAALVVGVLGVAAGVTLVVVGIRSRRRTRPTPPEQTYVPVTVG
jgi:hypothetical protein